MYEAYQLINRLLAENQRLVDDNDRLKARVAHFELLAAYPPKLTLRTLMDRLNDRLCELETAVSTKAAEAPEDNAYPGALK